MRLLVKFEIVIGINHSKTIFNSCRASLNNLWPSGHICGHYSDL